MRNETTDGALAHRYGRLLLAYPRWYRRLHGADMITAMVDAAAEGHPSTAGREAWTLVTDGLRCRFRVTGWGSRVLVACLSLIAAGVLMATAGRIGWLAAAPWPSVPQATVLAAPVLPPAAPDSVNRRDAAIGPWLDDADSVALTLAGSPELRPGGVYLAYVRPHEADPAEALRTARARLDGTGWRTTVHGGELFGERAGLRLKLLIAGREETTDDVIVSVSPLPPRLGYVLGGLGALFGALLGWLLGAAAVARARRADPVTRLRLGGLAGAGTVLSVPASLLNGTALAIADTDGAGAPPWLGYQFFAARPAAVIGAALLVTALLWSNRVDPAAGWTADREECDGRFS